MISYQKLTSMSTFRVNSTVPDKTFQGSRIAQKKKCRIKFSLKAVH